jgi:hypothetical protein
MTLTRKTSKRTNSSIRTKRKRENFRMKSLEHEGNSVDFDGSDE